MQGRTRWTASIIVMAALVGCHSSDDFQPKTATFHGAMTLDQSHGTVSLAGANTPETPGLINLHGELAIDGQSPIALIGYYNPQTAGMNFGTETWTYSFGGHVSDGFAIGTGLYSHGDGSFALFLDTASANVSRYCAAAVCTAPAGCAMAGSFNVMTSNGRAAITGSFGQALVYAGTPALASGVDMHYAVYFGDGLTLQGDTSGGTISGTWVASPSGNSGSWSGDASQCN